MYCPDRLVNRVMGGWPPMAVWGHGDITELQQRLDDVDDAITGVEAREANIRTGYIYVISNIGAFGPDVVKIGLTRRLDPHDRIRELGDASVPFRFDTHALVVATTPSPSRPACTRSSPTVGQRDQPPPRVLPRHPRPGTRRAHLDRRPASPPVPRTPEALEWRASNPAAA